MLNDHAPTTRYRVADGLSCRTLSSSLCSFNSHRRIPPRSCSHGATAAPAATTAMASVHPMRHPTRQLYCSSSSTAARDCLDSGSNGDSVGLENQGVDSLAMAEQLWIAIATSLLWGCTWHDEAQGNQRTLASLCLTTGPHVAGEHQLAVSLIRHFYPQLSL